MNSLQISLIFLLSMSICFLDAFFVELSLLSSLKIRSMFEAVKHRLQTLHSYHLNSGAISSQWNYLIRQWKIKVKTKTEIILILKPPEKNPGFYVTFHFTWNLECSGKYCQQSVILTNFEPLFLVFSTQFGLDWETTEIKG